MGRDRLDVLAPGDAQTSLKAKVGDRSWGVLWANRRGQEKAADWPFQKSGIRVRSGHLRSTKNFNNFQTDRFTSRFDPFILETDPFTFQIDSLHFLI